jgi:hypothetical protein
MNIKIISLLTLVMAVLSMNKFALIVAIVIEVVDGLRSMASQDI